MTIGPEQLRRGRDAVIRYLYANAGHKIGFAMDAEAVRAAVGLTRDEFEAVTTLLWNQGLSGGPGAYIGSVNLSNAGQHEAERIGPDVRLRELTDAQTVHINASYSVVQVAGANSRLSATMNQVNSLSPLLDEIEKALARLDLSPAKKDEAKGLLDSLRAGLGGKLADAGMRAIGGALGSILIAAGSSLGQSLMQALHIAVG